MKTEVTHTPTWIDAESYRRVLAQRDELVAAGSAMLRAFKGFKGYSEAYSLMESALEKLEAK